MLAGVGGSNQQAARESATICAEKDKPESSGCLLPVIASEAKQSIYPRAEMWIASLAMTETQ